MTAFANTWKTWRCVQVQSGPAVLTIGVSAGPRIVSLSYEEGANLLYEDHTGFRVGEWILYGGHRFTIAPETERSYYPEPAACLVDAIGDKVMVTAPVRPDRLQLLVTVTGSRESCGFKIDHTITNRGASSWQGAPWAITCVPPGAEVRALYTGGPVRHWPGTDPAIFPIAAEAVIPVTGTLRGKAGWHAPDGWLAAVQPAGNLIIRNLDDSTAGECEDGGCNLELFVCADFTELETLGRRVTLLPGQSVSHRQQWQVYPPASLF